MSRSSVSTPLLTLAVVALVVCGIVPLVMMSGRLVAEPEALSRLLDPRTKDLLLRTLMLGGGVVAFALLVGVPFGFLVARTDVPGAGLLGPLGVVPLLMPPLVLAMTWVIFIDLRGAPMTVLMLGLSTYPIVAVFTARAAERVDARQEEAALLAGGLPAALRVHARLLAPAVACACCLVFVFAINDFGVPDYVSSKGPKFNVYADEIFATWQIDNRDADAVATALPLIALTLLALIPALILRRRGALASTLGSGFQRPARLALGAWRWPALVFCLLVVSAGVLLPVGRMVYEAGGGAGFETATLRKSFQTAIEQCREELLNSVLYAGAAACLAVGLGLVLGHAIARLRGGAALLILSVLPLAVPAILLGVGFIVLWNQPWSKDLYESPALVVMLLIARYLAFPVLVLSGAAASLDRQLEESAALAGARPARRLFGVVAPPLVPALAGAWILFFVLAMREMDAAILVPAANRTIMFRLFNAVHFGRSDYVAAMALMTLFVIVLPGLLWMLFSKRKLELLP